MEGIGQKLIITATNQHPGIKINLGYNTSIKK